MFTSLVITAECGTVLASYSLVLQSSLWLVSTSAELLTIGEIPDVQQVVAAVLCNHSHSTIICIMTNKVM